MYSGNGNYRFICLIKNIKVIVEMIGNLKVKVRTTREEPARRIKT